MKNVVPPAGYPRIVEAQGNGVTVGAVAAVAAVGGAVVGGAAVMAKNLGKDVPADTGSPAGKSGRAEP